MWCCCRIKLFATSPAHYFPTTNVSPHIKKVREKKLSPVCHRNPLLMANSFHSSQSTQPGFPCSSVHPPAHCAVTTCSCAHSCPPPPSHSFVLSLSLFVPFPSVCHPPFPICSLSSPLCHHHLFARPCAHTCPTRSLYTHVLDSFLILIYFTLLYVWLAKYYMPGCPRLQALGQSALCHTLSDMFGL